MLGNHVVGIGQARAGSILIEVKGSTAEIEMVRAEISRSTNYDVNVKTMQSKAIIEILDLDEGTTNEEVMDVVSTLLGAIKGNSKVMSMRQRYGGTHIAQIATTVARAILKGGPLLVWSEC